MDYFWDYAWNPERNSSRPSYVHFRDEVCGGQRECLLALSRAMQVVVLREHSSPWELGTVLAAGAEFLLGGAFHPPGDFHKENRLLLEKSNLEEQM